MYTFEEDILHFIFIAFKGLKRKKEDIDLVFHSVMVGNMLKNIGCSENIVYTGYLHDIIEDTKYSYEDLKERYGKELAVNVQKLSENTKILNYKERKEEFINRLKNYNNNLILVELADKLQNLVSDYSLFLSLGKDALPSEAKTYEEIKWFYTELKKIFNEKLEENSLLERYNNIYEKYFND
jgi:(p)ppGpp synthase/HD superfamily hydrolase